MNSIFSLFNRLLLLVSFIYDGLLASLALYSAGIQQQDIKFTLHWKSDSFYMYLRNLPCQASCTAATILDFDPQRFTLIPNAHNNE